MGWVANALILAGYIMVLRSRGDKEKVLPCLIALLGCMLYMSLSAAKGDWPVFSINATFGGVNIYGAISNLRK